MRSVNFHLDQILRIAELPYNKKAHELNEERNLIA